MRSVTRPATEEVASSSGSSSTSRASQPRQPAAPASKPAAPVGEEQGGEAAWWSWAGVGVPIILRVPRGVAILIAIGLIGLLVLAYWVGHSRGETAGAERARAELEQNLVADGGRPAPGAPPTGALAGDGPQGQAGVVGGLVGEGGDGVSQGRGQGGVSGPIAAGSPDDPREPGLNYMVVARYEPEEAQRVGEFLTDLGVEIVLELEDNERFVRVWAVGQGFAGNEMGGEAYNAYRAELRDAGRAWQRHNRGLGDAFETMYARKYQGE